ncbi:MULTISPECIES: putative quinol monooxygenase [Sphingomonas]|jgi:quinol monooxygenase YgiN|uniref:Antibiotic biosynthesis monooxygenase n=1 Tax=Sphingomonas ginsenosidimutans TaxID=862134 RepID=A0A2A4I0H5_9SPHN|nr:MULTISPECIES: putative quinol monooxygenase [Sphingomonas]MBY0302510.1 antibiotic biosynthesis monooxygenase [Sphingomonas ginsenosidimutans]PCG10286.1 antibiotic biosynthesis monooxygenase [Sphingomonas ginsenosidimutans]
MGAQVTLVILGTFRVPPDRLGTARGAMARMIAASRAEDGCLDYAYAEDVHEPGLIRVSEVWRDRASLARHMASAHLAEWRAEWPALGIGERDLRWYAAGDAEPA